MREITAVARPGVVGTVDAGHEEERMTTAAAGDGDELAATWVVEGEIDVTVDGRTIRVLVPAGVGVPGLSDTDLALELVRLLREHDEPLPDVIDVAMVVARRPELLIELEADLDV